MERDHRLYDEFLAELRALEDFRLAHQERHAPAHIDREDPEVRRMIEALAYFSVQTRRTAQTGLAAATRRLLASHFEPLLRPRPATAIIEAVVGDRHAEPKPIARGEQVRLTARDGSVGSFRTLRDLQVLPVTLRSCDVLTRGRGSRLVLEFGARFERRLPVGHVGLYVSYLDSYLGSLGIWHQLRQHLDRCTVVYEELADADTLGEPCIVSFGSGIVGEGEREEPVHPLERVRDFFHHPERELFLDIEVPPSERAWRRFSLCLDLDEGWTRSRGLGRDTFRPFAVPVVNLKHESATPIVCDGTQSTHAIRALHPDRGWALHSVTGVFEITKRGLEPLVPAALGTGGRVFDIDCDRTPTLILRLPEAFVEPRKVAVEAEWYQPDFDESAIGRMAVTLPERHLEGVHLEVLGGVRAHAPSPLDGDMARLLEVLSWKMKPVLERDELVAVLRLCGAGGESPYRHLPQKLRELTSSRAPDSALRGSGIRQRYRLTLDSFSPDEEPLVWSFLVQVRAVLDAWNPDATVDLEVETPGSQLAPLPE